GIPEKLRVGNNFLHMLRVIDSTPDKLLCVVHNFSGELCVIDGIPEKLRVGNNFLHMLRVMVNILHRLCVIDGCAVK
ncbi:MAG: hypothetical protein IJR85_11200, partial [Synergistaceae bacterium]|nr:hypothetical protein [Synergistaceae bacterium]